MLPDNPEYPGPIKFAARAVLFHAVDEPIRAQILLLLGDGERTVDDLGAEIGCNPAVLSKHLRLLRLAGLVGVRQDGWYHAYTLTDAGRELRDVIEVLGA